MASKISDREYVERILQAMEGKPNALKARKIAIFLGGRIRQRLMACGKIPRENPAPASDREITPKAT